LGGRKGEGKRKRDLRSILLRSRFGRMLNGAKLEEGREKKRKRGRLGVKIFSSPLYFFPSYVDHRLRGKKKRKEKKREEQAPTGMPIDQRLTEQRRKKEKKKKGGGNK